ncbi:MAG: PD40 domain-containing protein [Thermoleophilaceae bacterium]|nr:PD40 domain-containing protein [Thermoleophilaceae bacterium]
MLVAAIAPSAQAGTVAFSSDRCDSQADYEQRPGFTVPRDDANPSCRPAIWLVEDDGSGLRRLTNGGEHPPGQHQPGADFEPAWSPDGQRIAYGSSGTVMVASVNGGQPRRITFGNTPAWTPDGLGVVVSAPDETDPIGTGDLNLYAVSIDGSRTNQLTFSPEDEVAPELSPDGRRLLFSRRLSGQQRFGNRAPREPPPEFVPGARLGWFSMSLPDRREERMVLSDQDPGWGARFSPDGQRIALSLFGSLHTMNADGTNLRRHSAQGSVSPTWAGLDSLIYVRFPPGGSGKPGLAKLRLDNDAQPVAITTSASRFGDNTPDWHPVGGLLGRLPLEALRPSSSFSTKAPEGAPEPSTAPLGARPSRKRSPYPGVV